MCFICLYITVPVLDNSLQIEDTLSDEHRSLSKSRVPMLESRRIRPAPAAPIDAANAHASGGGGVAGGALLAFDSYTEGEPSRHNNSGSRNERGGVDEGEKEGEFDLEVYNDRMFYAMLLKVLLCSAVQWCGVVYSDELRIHGIIDNFPVSRCICEACACLRSYFASLHITDLYHLRHQQR